MFSALKGSQFYFYFPDLFSVIGSLFAALIVIATAYDVIVIQWLMAEDRDASGYQVTCIRLKSVLYTILTFGAKEFSFRSCF